MEGFSRESRVDVALGQSCARTRLPGTRYAHPLRIAILSADSYLPARCGTRKLIDSCADSLSGSGHTVVRIDTADHHGTTTWNLGLRALRALLLAHNVGARFSASQVVAAGVAYGMLWKPDPLIRAAITEADPHVILVEDLYSAYLARPLSRTLGIPWTLRVHHLEAARRPGTPSSPMKALFALESTLLNSASCLIALTTSDRALLASRYTPPTYYSPATISPLETRARQPLNPPRGAYALYVSSYVGGEQSWLLALAAIVGPQGLVLAGECQGEFDDLSEQVSLTGEVSDCDLKALYDNCGFVFIPLSWSPGQGVPIKLLEALGSGRPIVLHSSAAWLLGEFLPPGVFLFDSLPSLRTAVARATHCTRVPSREARSWQQHEEGIALSDCLHAALDRRGANVLVS